MPRILLLVLLLGVSAAAEPFGVRIILGLTDQETATWNGSASIDRGRIGLVEGWRFEGEDGVNGSSWRAQTHPIRLFGAQAKQGPAVVANGVVVWLAEAEESSRLTVKTTQGEFSVVLSEIPFGKSVRRLDGRVMLDRLPRTTRLTATPDEQDYPSVAMDKGGDLWLAYIEFKHHPEHNRIRANFRERPANFDDMKAAPGGDQVMLRRFSQGAWGEPVAITPAGGDLYRPAVAVDGAGRAWVFWSANEKGNFDLWARALDKDKLLDPVRLTSAPGADVFPAAATDAKGRVWVAWQGWRNGRAAIFAASQQAGGFSAPAAVSGSTANEWNPSIAAHSDGRVAVAWDSYRNGSYDVYARLATAPARWGAEIPLAATPRYEAYPSIAFDPSGTLWVAYEEAADGWGKDFGAYETAGVAVYQGRAVRLAGLDPTGKRVEPAARPGASMPGPPARRVDLTAMQDDADAWLTPDAAASKNRSPSATPPAARGPKNSLPRLTVDGSGRLWLAFRSAHPIWWNPIGTVWSEYVVSCEGSECVGPIFLAHSDNLLDNRPAVVAPRAGELVVVGSSDQRRRFADAFRPRGVPAGAQKKGKKKAAAAPVPSIADMVTDPYNNDLWFTRIALAAARGPLAVKGTAVPKAPAVVLDRKEQTQAAALRSHRVASRDGALKLIRGEFHRHSEVSMDGGGDGTIIDQWRYIIDPAHMDWVGCCDHDNGGGREYSWWTTQKLTDIFYSPGRFAPMFSYERSVAYPEGHRNVVFVQRGVRPLPRLPKLDESVPGKAPDTQMFYDYLRAFNGLVASHTSATNMGTDWRDNDPRVEPVVEIYQGDRQNYEMPGAPRANSEGDSIGGWRPKGFVNLALEMGYKLGFQASSDHISTHMSYCNLFVRDTTREAVLDAFQKRHVYGATDDILADVRCGAYMMGDVFSLEQAPELKVKLAGTAPFAKVHVIRNNQYVYTTEPRRAAVEFAWRDNAPIAGKMSYYYVRGEQEDGELVWASPMWITYTGK
jgi:hypothetical protein